MAEGMNRPTTREPFDDWSRRLRFCDPAPTKFELAKLLADYLVEAWRGFHVDPLAAFQVRTRGDTLVVRCLCSRSFGWHVARRLSKNGFAGRDVVVEKGWGDDA